MYKKIPWASQKPRDTACKRILQQACYLYLLSVFSEYAMKDASGWEMFWCRNHSWKILKKCCKYFSNFSFKITTTIMNKSAISHGLSFSPDCFKMNRSKHYTYTLYKAIFSLNAGFKIYSRISTISLDFLANV